MYLSPFYYGLIAALSSLVYVTYSDGIKKFSLWTQLLVVFIKIIVNIGLVVMVVLLIFEPRVIHWESVLSMSIVMQVFCAIPAIILQWFKQNIAGDL
jgi:hypothetical protein